MLLKSTPTLISSSDLLSKGYRELRTRVLKQLFVEAFWIPLTRGRYYSISKKH